jgi:hypothetical protein
VDEGVAAEEADDAAAALGRGHDQLAARCSGERKAVVVDTPLEHLYVSAGRVDQVAVAGLLHHDDVGVGEELDGPDGQQAGVAGTGADEGDAADAATGLLGGTLPHDHGTVSS